MAHTQPPDASVTVFAQNEAARIGACLASLATACEGANVTLTVIVNGSSDGTADAALRAAQVARMPARIYSIAFGDKSNAINQAIHHLLRPAQMHVFVDGYAAVTPSTLRALSDALAHNPRAMAASGVAGNGRTMAQATEETLQKGGRLHGQLHAFRPDFLARMVAGGLRLPTGLYRGDGLLGSMACHNLDALGEPWDDHRIAGAAGAVFMIPPLSPWRPSDILRQLRRMVRQARGRLENAAIKSIIYKSGYAGLPAHADDMIAAWLAGGGVPQSSLADRPFMALALRQHARALRPERAALEPVLVDTV